MATLGNHYRMREELGIMIKSTTNCPLGYSYSRPSHLRNTLILTQDTQSWRQVWRWESHSLSQIWMQLALLLGPMQQKEKLFAPLLPSNVSHTAPIHRGRTGTDHGKNTPIQKGGGQEAPNSHWSTAILMSCWRNIARNCYPGVGNVLGLGSRFTPWAWILSPLLSVVLGSTL